MLGAKLPGQFKPELPDLTHRWRRTTSTSPDGHPNSPTNGHFKFPHPDDRVTVADPARVRGPNRKGAVENAIGHTQSTALKGRRFRQP
jgi:hypothetical protein